MGLQLIDWKELKEYKDLFFFLVWRDIKVLYKQTMLGFAWAIIRPVFSMIVFSVIFGRLAKIPSDGIPYPIFAYTALVPWTYFSTAISKSTQSLIANANMLSKVYFPRLIIPMTPVLAGLVDFLISFSILGILMAWYGIWPNPNILFLPLLVILMVLTAAGIGMLLSAMAIQYRDIKHVTPFLIQLLLYAAPVIWPVSLIPEKYRLLYGLYPMAGVIEGFRSALLGKAQMPWDLISVSCVTSCLISVFGLFYFRKFERFFSDVV
jgi:lipopolysaccharide transport system permease protein